jgi:SEC-C motif-containing protein
MSKNNCPCDSDKTFSTCCKPVIDDIKSASSPEQLMRSRYTAFTLKDMNYIFESTHPQARHEFDRKSNQEWADQAHFSKLEILKSSNEGNKGFVEFKAYFKINETETIHHEVASFRKQSEVWYFRDAKIVK